MKEKVVALNSERRPRDGSGERKEEGSIDNNQFIHSHHMTLPFKKTLGKNDDSSNDSIYNTTPKKME